MISLDSIQLIQSIFLLQIICYLLLSIFFKPNRSGKVYCGIFAFNGPTKLSEALCHMVLNNIKMLGLYNDERGGDNAGIVINNKILHTTSFESKFKTLLDKNHIDILNPELSTVIIGHSRKGSVGGKGHENAHPFKIYNNDKDVDVNWYMTGVHNGTIENWQTILKNFNLDPKEFKNDSKTMLKILSRQRNLKKNKKFNVLEKYKGAGVFIWYFQDEPDAMYVFKGARKRYKTSLNFEEERPLYFYECPITGGIYFSSIKESLQAIAINKNDVKNLDTNIVFKIKQGKLIEGESIEIDRSEMYEFGSTTPYSSNYESRANRDADFDSWDEHEFAYGYAGMGGGRYPNVGEQVQIGIQKKWQKQEQEAAAKAKALVDKVIPINRILGPSSEEKPKFIYLADDEPRHNIKFYKNKIYRQEGLYYLNGSKVTGEFIVNERTCEIFDSSQKELLEQANIYKARYFFEGYILKGKAALVDLQTFDRDFPNGAWKADKSQYFMAKYCNYPVPTWDGKLYYIGGTNSVTKANGEFTGLPYCELKVYDFKEGKRTFIRRPVTPVAKQEAILRTLPIGLPTHKEIIDPDAAPLFSAEDLDKILATPDGVLENIQRNEDYERKIEELAIIDAQEEEILELWKALHEKVEEQMYTMKPYIKDKTIEPIHFLSGTLSMYGFACVDGGLTTTSGNIPESPYFKLDDKEQLSYKKISKINLF